MTYARTVRGVRNHGDGGDGGVKVGSLNVRSIMKIGKQKDMLEEFMESNLDILCI